MATHTAVRDLVDRLSRTEGKAEIVRGELVLMSPAGGMHGNAAGSLYASLREYGQKTKRGRAYPDNVGYLVTLPTRGSFCPDASFHVGPPPGRGFLEGAPYLAVEVRSPDDYGAVAEEALAAKRADYFAAGTSVVLDVDMLRDIGIAVYRAQVASPSVRFRGGEVVVVEPEMPGWTFRVDALFE